jgi:hypothetical protein
VLLNIASMEVPGANQEKQIIPPGTKWAGYLDNYNRNMRLFMGGPEVAAAMKKNGGPLSNGIALVKQ